MDYLNTFCSISLYPVQDPYLTKNMEYPTFIHIREELGVMNLFKSFLYITTVINYLIFNISNDALKLFSSISMRY